MTKTINRILSANGRGLAKSDSDAESMKYSQRLLEQQLVDSDRNLTEDIQLDDEEKNSKGGYANRILQPESSTGVGQGTGGDVAVTGNFMRVMNQTGSGVPTMTAKLSSRRRNSPLRGRGS